MSDDVKAGTYELVADLWDEPLSKPGEPFDFKRHRTGDKVTLDVEEARRLVTAGAVVKPGEREKAALAAAQAALQAALAAIPEEYRDQITAEPVKPEPSTPPSDTPTPKPAPAPSGSRR